MLKNYNVMDIERILQEEKPPMPFPPASDRAAWNQIRERLRDGEAAWFIRQAEEASAKPIPPMPATLYLEVKRTGRREGYQEPMWERQVMMRDLALGECLEEQGRFLDPLMDVIWAICEESSWVYPAHHYDLPDMEHPYIDLNVATTGLFLAEVNLLLSDQLDPAVGKRIRYEVNRRLFEPYLARHDWWWLYNTAQRETNNWNAVCNAGVMGAAIYLEQDPARLAEILAKGLRSLDDYLDTFDRDGGSSEGPGYWSYGFGNYTIIAHLVEHRTNGKVRMMDGDLLYKIGQFPLRTALSPNVWVNFSDSPRFAQFVLGQLTYLAGRLNLPGLLELAQRQPRFEARPDFTWRLRELVWQIPEPSDAPFRMALHDWYDGMMWMFSRYDPVNPEGLVLAAKGGHNDEMHNQNDVGNFIVHFRQESLIADTGTGRYTRQYFGPERYEHFATASLGHSVPMPNEVMQREGKAFAARLIEHSTTPEGDVLTLDLKGAYPAEAGLESLTRRLAFHREAPHGWVELEDHWAFENGPAPFETALTTFEQVDQSEAAVLIHGLRGKLRVGFDPDSTCARVDLFKDIDLNDGLRDVYRIVFTPVEPTAEGTIRLEIVPVD